MTPIDYCILGAGPSGLVFANALRQRGITSFILLEKEREAGGLCRSVEVDGAPLDIGGGHFLDMKRKQVLDFLFRFMPESEWQVHRRVSKIRLRGVEIDHPVEGNLWQLPTGDQVDFIESIARAGCVNGVPEPVQFDEWIRWKLGGRIADEYMLPYNRKMWCMPLQRLGTYWLHKLPAVSFRETLASCLERKAGGTLPAHGTFLYPKKCGYGEVWKRLGAELGAQLVLDCPVERIDPQARTVNGQYRYKRLISTIPWPLWRGWSALPEEVDQAVAALVHTTVDVDYVPENLPSNSHWTYEPAESKTYHRQLLRHNFCAGARGHWTEANARRSGPAVCYRHRNEYAYPVNTIGKVEAMAAISRWAAANDITPLGRWGVWEHMNSDVAVEAALRAADTFTP